MGLSNYYEDREHRFEMRISELEEQLADARAEIRRIKHCENATSDMLAAREVLIEQKRAEIERKDKLIEQMREALIAAKNDGKLQSAITYQLIRAALSAADGGE